MNFKKYFEARQSSFVYEDIAAKSILAIIILQTIYFIAFTFLYANGYKEVDDIMSIPLMTMSFSIVTWFLLKNYKRVRANIIMILAHIITCIISFFSIKYFGWGYGFYILLIMVIGLNYVHNLKTNIINISISFIEVCLFVFLLIKYKNATPIIQTNDFIESCFHIFNFLFAASTIIFYANTTKISNKLTIYNLKNQKEELEQKSKIDFLTGLANRRIGETYIQKLIQSIENKKITSFVFCIGDLDNFKKINDTYGHNFGDKVLKEIASIIKNKLSGINDVCIRWGGEEFVILITNASFEKSYEKIEDIRESIENNHIFFENKAICVTISFGFVYVENKCDIEDIIKKADTLMYKVKTSGKNSTAYAVM